MMSNTSNQQLAALLQQLAQVSKQSQQNVGLPDQAQFQGPTSVDKGNMNLLQGTELSQTKQGLGLSGFLPRTNGIQQLNPASQQPIYKEIKDMLQFQAPSTVNQQQQAMNAQQNMLQSTLANTTAAGNQSPLRFNVQNQDKLIQQQAQEINEAFQGQQQFCNQKIGPISTIIDPSSSQGFSAFKSIGGNDGLQKLKFTNAQLFGQTLSKSMKPSDEKLQHQVPTKQTLLANASKAQVLPEQAQDNAKDNQNMPQISQNCPNKFILTSKPETLAPPQAKKTYIDQIAQLLEKQRNLRKSVDKGQSQALNENLTPQSIFPTNSQTFQNDASQIRNTIQVYAPRPEGQMSAASNLLVDQLGTNATLPTATQGLKPQATPGQSKQATEKFLDLMLQIQNQKPNQNKEIIQNQSQQETRNKRPISELVDVLNWSNVDDNLLSQFLKPDEQQQPEPPLPPVVNTNTQQQYAQCLLELLNSSQQGGREQQQFEPVKVIPQQPQPPAALKNNNMLSNTLNNLQLPTQQNQAYTNDLDKVSQILLQQQSNVGLGGLQQQPNQTQNSLQKMQFVVGNFENQNNALPMNSINAPSIDFKAASMLPTKEASSSNFNIDALLSVLGLLNTKNINTIQSQQLQQALGDLLTTQTQQQQQQQQIQDQNQSLISKLLGNECNNTTKTFTQNDQGINENEKIIEALLGGNQLNFQQETPVTNPIANKGLFGGLNGLDQQSLLTNQNFLNLGNTGAVQQVQQAPQSAFNGQNTQRDLLGNQLNCTHKQPTKPNQQFNCPHVDKKQYAKNMCHNCYHRKGKSKMANKCEHVYRSHYSNGLCQNCYLAQYYQKRKAKQLEKQGTEKPADEGAGTASKPVEDDEGPANGASSRDGKDGAYKSNDEDQLLQDMPAANQQVNNKVEEPQSDERNNEFGQKRQKIDDDY